MIEGRIPGLVLVIALAVVAGFAVTALRFLPSLDTDHPALADVPIVHEPAPPRLARRVILVIFDGLRLDTSRGLPFLDRLRARGVDGAAHVPFPTLSIPNYVTILSGVEPRWSGVRNNEWTGTLALDTLPARIAALQQRVGFASDHVQPAGITGVPGERWDHLLPTTLGARSDILLVLAPTRLDKAGHEFGGAGNGYRVMARTIDDQLAQLLEVPVDLATDAIVVVSDHGHSDRGGHGDDSLASTQVPLVLAGAGVRRGVVLHGAQLTDVAPTIAALLGVPAPAHATGRILLDALDVTPAQRMALAGADAERLARIQPMLALIETTEHADHEARRVLGLIVGGAGALAIVILLVVAVRRRCARIDIPVLAAASVFPIVVCLSIPLLGLGLTPPHSPGDTLALVLELSGHLALAAGATAIALALALRQRSPDDRVAAATGAVLSGLVVTAVPAAACWALIGVHGATLLPAPAIFMLTPITAAIAATHALVGALALALCLVSRAAERRSIVAP